MNIFSQLYENVFTISLIFTEENISESSASAAKLIVFIKFYIQIYDMFGVYSCVKITSEYTQTAPIASFTSYLGKPLTVYYKLQVTTPPIFFKKNYTPGPPPHV